MAANQDAPPDTPQGGLTPAVFALTGLPGSGRRALAGKLADQFARLGLKTGVILGLDHEPEEQTDPLARICPGGVLEVQGGRLVLQLPQAGETSPEILAANFLAGADIVIVISGAALNLPSVDLMRAGLGQRLPITRKPKNLIAITGQPPETDKDRPFIPENDPAALAEAVINRLRVANEEKDSFGLAVNGLKVPVVPFVRRIIASTVFGLVGSLKSCENAETVELRLNRAALKTFQKR